MKFRIVTLAGLLGLATTVMPGAVTNLAKTAAGLVQDKHDLKNSTGYLGCKTCHAPHNGAAQGFNDTTGQYLLWAANMPTVATYGTYTSASLSNLKVTIGELGGGLSSTSTTTSPDVRMYSILCLSCHDGTSANASSFSYINGGSGMLPKNQVAAVGSANSSGLLNDHPVNVEYNVAKDTNLNAITSGSLDVGGLPLYTNSAGVTTMQCATCHDPHNDLTNTMFLRNANDSNHCLTCHK